MKNIEIEQKFRIKNAASIRKTLRRLGAKRTGTGREENEFYDIARGLRKKRISLRLRRYQGRGLLTLKGRRQGMHRTLSKRMEVESPVNFLQMRLLLNLLGFKKWLSYSKTRETWQLPGAEVVIDYFPRFGWFAEIESSQARIHRLAKTLGLLPEHAVAESYLAMQLRGKHLFRR